MDELTRALRRSRGDAEAFAEVIRRAQPEVWRFCRRVVGPDDADDVTQEVFVAAWRARGAFRAESSARTWLFAIARRTAHAHVRRRSRDAVASRDADPVARSLDDRRDVVTLLSELDVDRRTALVLTQAFGFTYAQTAAICGCPVGTVRSRVARAREELLDRWDAGADRELRARREAR